MTFQFTVLPALPFLRYSTHALLLLFPAHVIDCEPEACCVRVTEGSH